LKTDERSEDWARLRPGASAAPAQAQMQSIWNSRERDKQSYCKLAPIRIASVSEIKTTL